MLHDFQYVSFVTVKEGKITVHSTQWALLDPLFHPEDHACKSGNVKVEMARVIFNQLLPADGDYRLTASGSFLFSFDEVRECTAVKVLFKEYSYDPADPGIMRIYQPNHWNRATSAFVTFGELPA